MLFFLHLLTVNFCVITRGCHIRCVADDQRRLPRITENHPNTFENYRNTGRNTSESFRSSLEGFGRFPKTIRGREFNHPTRLKVFFSYSIFRTTVNVCVITRGFHMRITSWLVLPTIHEDIIKV